MSRNANSSRRIAEVLFRRPDGSIAWPRIVGFAVLLGVYLLLQPWLVRSFGLPLPGFAELGEIAGNAPAVSPPASTNDSKHSRPPPTRPQDAGATNGETNKRSTSPPSDRDSTDAPQSAKPERTSPEREAASFSEYLRDVGGDVFESPAGLRYIRGSRQGHRVQHVLYHASDVPSRPGQHGVFDPGDALAVFQLIDKAYKQAESGRRTETRREGDRIVYTVDVGRRIGYVGGQSGARRNHPPARHVRMVLQGKNVITAFPYVP